MRTGDEVVGQVPRAQAALRQALPQQQVAARRLGKAAHRLHIACRRLWRLVVLQTMNTTVVFLQHCGLPPVQRVQWHAGSTIRSLSNRPCPAPPWEQSTAHAPHSDTPHSEGSPADFGREQHSSLLAL